MIVVDKVTKYYGANEALSELSFKVNEGEVIGLLGLNGAGKTTTLRMLSGLLAPTSGSITVAGVDMVQKSFVARSKIGFSPETPPLYGEMSVRNYLIFVARIKGIKRREVQGAVEVTMQTTDLLHVADETISTLSHGYQRRVGIAQAIIHRPDFVLLDEPTSGLDPVQVVQMREMIESFKGKHTVLISSHILSEIHAICDRILILQNGRIVAEGCQEELASRFLKGQRVELEVRGKAVEIEKILSKLPFVSTFQKIGSSDKLLRYTADLKSDQPEELNRALVAGGIGVRSLTRSREELEEIFLHLTGNKSPENTATEVPNTDAANQSEEERKEGPQ
ncbi:ABC transporter ATP-binding protein [Myxococcota bacterium]|nr:ABC transporter ATP-binding protein [Myxococcota bacterium]